jgi:hypothetical protein
MANCTTLLSLMLYVGAQLGSTRGRGWANWAIAFRHSLPDQPLLRSTLM